MKEGTLIQLECYHDNINRFLHDECTNRKYKIKDCARAEIEPTTFYVNAA